VGEAEKIESFCNADGFNYPRKINNFEGGETIVRMKIGELNSDFKG